MKTTQTTQPNFRKIIAENDANKLANSVRNTILKYAQREGRALEKAHKRRDTIKAEIVNEYEAENRELRDQLRYSVAFLHSDKELEAYNAFCKKHESCRLTAKINGGKIPYVTQYGTGVGVCTTVHCQVCGESEDITDSTIW